MIRCVHVFARRPWLAALILVWAWGWQGAAGQSPSTDPLPSWNDGAAKQAIVGLVGAVTKAGGADFVPAEQRIAVFDNDGTLWAEQPIYFQVAFALDRIKALAPRHPEWKDTQPFKAVLEGDHKALAAAGVKGLVEVVDATHPGMTLGEFEAVVRDWLATAWHPRFDRPYTDRRKASRSTC